VVGVLCAECCLSSHGGRRTIRRVLPLFP